MVTRLKALAASLVAIASCGFPRPQFIGTDAASGDAALEAALDAPTDVSEPSGAAIHVSAAGDDANDGVTNPVKTLKRAIVLSAANHEIHSIVLASGRYSSANGETFPYSVPADVTLMGTIGGGATIAGTTAEAGLIVDNGGLQDVVLEDFMTGIIVTGTASLKNVRVAASGLALQAETAATLTVQELDITGTTGACAVGIVLNGAAHFTATTLTIANLGTALNARDQSTTNISNAHISSDRSCSQSLSVININTSISFALNDSVIDGGPNSGIQISPRSSSFQASIANTAVRNMRSNGLGGGAPVGGSMSFEMTGGELSHNGNGGADLGDGTWTFTKVKIEHNVGLAIYIQDASMIMRGCNVTANGGGIDVFDNASADLGTTADFGNNTFQVNGGVGLTLDGAAGARLISAVGNTWNPSTQGADPTGRYGTSATILGPVPFANGNNFSINERWSLSR